MAGINAHYRYHQDSYGNDRHCLQIDCFVQAFVLVESFYPYSSRTNIDLPPKEHTIGFQGYPKLAFRSPSQSLDIFGCGAAASDLQT